MTDGNHLATAAMRRFTHVVAVGALVLLGTTAAWVARAQSPEADPPGRAARLSDVDGPVWLMGADDDDWIAVDRNRPLTAGDRIATDNGARAEISLGSTTLRLDSGSEIEILQLDDSNWNVRLDAGSVSAQLRSSQSLAGFSLETDEGQFRIQAVGRYRFDRADDASDLTVYSGRAVFEGRDSALPLLAGQHAQFWLDAKGAAQYSMSAPLRDDFAAWNDERDRTENRVAAARYVSPEMTGAADLDAYGDWQQSPDDGPIWIPRGVASGWVPYSAGHWAWIRPWGWSWVDDAPWGFAPFHYGRWVRVRDRWGWAPGTYVARPVYAPALVGWVGGARVDLSIPGASGPPVGWFPLAPHEVWVPSYRSSPRYWRQVNAAQVADVGRIDAIVRNAGGPADRRDFSNRHIPGAVTVVPMDVLSHRQPVGPAALQLRGNVQVREMFATDRGLPVMAAAPVQRPSQTIRPPGGRVTPPPFQRHEAGAPATRPAQGGARPLTSTPRPAADTIERPAPRGRIGREPTSSLAPSATLQPPRSVEVGRPVDPGRVGRPALRADDPRSTEGKRVVPSARPEVLPATGAARTQQTARPADAVPRSVETHPTEKGAGAQAPPADAARAVEPRRPAAGPRQTRPESRAPNDERRRREDRRDGAPDDRK